jgi:hypothetical protein
MARLIDADALRQTMESNLYWGLDSDGAILDTIDEAPTVDAVEVVRCKDCKWGATPYGDEHDGWTECTNLFGRPLMPDEGFCSYGERRTDE